MTARTSSLAKKVETTPRESCERGRHLEKPHASELNGTPTASPLTPPRADPHRGTPSPPSSDEESDPEVKEDVWVQEGQGQGQGEVFIISREGGCCEGEESGPRGEARPESGAKEDR